MTLKTGAPVDDAAMADYISSTFPGVETETALGYTFFFYGADHRIPFATMISADNEYDRVSDLDREGVYRLNIGVSKETFQSLFGTADPDVSTYDFTAVNTIMPHPEYSAQHFLCVLSPTGATLEAVQDLLREAHDISFRRASRPGRASKELGS